MPSATLDAGADAAVVGDARLGDDAPDASSASACGGACGGTATPVCDEGRGVCVACLTNQDCVDFDPTARLHPVCDPGTNTCGGCRTDADCLPFLDGRAGACDPVVGCVECTATNETACGGTVCDGGAHACSTVPPRTRGLCEPCIGDSECMEGMTCVQAALPDGATTQREAPHCVWLESATVADSPMGSCDLRGRPFSRSTTVTTYSGATATVCLLFETGCTALEDYTTGTDCEDGSGFQDEFCGSRIGEFPIRDLLDGYCRADALGAGRCTIACETDADCPVGRTCAVGPAPATCSL